jgi:hypothetical protein
MDDNIEPPAVLNSTDLKSLIRKVLDPKRIPERP